MENIANSKGFLHIFEKILLPLDAKTLVNCSVVSRSLASSLKNPRFWFKLCKQRNLINRCFKEWNKLLEITEESVPRKENISRILKIFCIDKKNCLKKVSDLRTWVPSIATSNFLPRIKVGRSHPSI